MKPRLSQEDIKAILDYDPGTGVFRWKIQQSNSIKSGDVAGYIDDGYRKISIFGAEYKAHRVAWVWMTGEWPVDQVDHRNRDRSDNRWSNLRQATTAENKQNQKIYKNNTSGLTGVTFDKKSKKWLARIGVCGVRKYLGSFDDASSAFAAYTVAKASLHSFNPFHPEHQSKSVRI